MENFENLILTFSKDEAENLYFTADSHFCHGHILDYCERPFKTIEEHDAVLIENWKKKVPENGVVFHLGDVGFGDSDRLKEIYDNLPGRIYLVAGNHDIRHIQKIKDRFELVTWQLLLQLGSRYVVLNHYPLLCYAGTYRQHMGHMTYQLFGHVHSKPGPSGTGYDIPRLAMLFPWQYDVGVDNNRYAPVSWKEVREKIQSKQDEWMKQGKIPLSRPGPQA